MMKLALTLEADSVNVQALNMGRIVVDIDGVNLAELINMVDLPLYFQTPVIT